MNQFVNQLLKKKEGERTEFKQRVPSRDILGRTLCSFANSKGGTIIIGVDDKGSVIGVTDADSVAQSLSRDAGTILSPSISVSVNVVEVEGKQILLVDIPEGLDKPYTFGRQVYIRHDDRSAHAEVHELRGLLSEAPRFEVRWERRLTGGIGESDLNQKEVARLAASAQDKFGYSFPVNADKTVQLELLNLASHGQLHNGAVVLFGRHPEHPFPQIRVRAIRFADDAETHILDNQVLEGNAFQLAEDSVKFIQSNIRVSSSITDASLVRKDETGLPMIALREAILNAIQHRDYEAYDGSIIIKIMPTSISIWNLGPLPKGMTVSDLKHVHYSRPRNPDIAHAFFLRGLVERIGSGTSRILTALRAADLPDAQWEVVSGGLEVTFRFSRVGAELNERQKALIEHIAEGDSITLPDYIRRFAGHVSPRQARGDLSDLAKKKLLEKHGAARSTRYERTPRKA
jgi:ATP-dependent DNA helicase RecG